MRWNAENNASHDYYNIYLDQNENPSSLVGTTIKNELSVHGLQANTTYYWKVVSENVLGSSDNCDVFSFTTGPDDYCEAKALVPRFEKINNVSVADINNSSTSTEGYENFTSITGNVERGQTYTISVDAERSSVANQLKVWIDYDQDKNFNEQTELVLNILEQAAPWTGTFTIPEDAPLGETRMRIRLLDVDPSPINEVNSSPCGDDGFGQVEDYTINVTDQLGIPDLSANGIQLYPNPVQDVLTINGSDTIKEIRIMDSLGKVQLKKEAGSAKLHLDMTLFQSGVYFITITLDDHTSYTSKIIKK